VQFEQPSSLRLIEELAFAEAPIQTISIKAIGELCCQDSSIQIKLLD
jgi:hypothetical protein